MKDNNSWRLSVAIAACVFIMLVGVFSLWKAALPHDESAGDDGGIQVVATVYPLYVSLLNITAGTPANLELLTPQAAGCAHETQLTTGDMKRLEAADLVVACGEGMEGFLDALQSTKGEAVVAVCEGWPELRSGNPHIWLSTDGAAYMVERITDALVAIDSTNAALYKRNCDEYTSRLAGLGIHLKEAMLPYRNAQVVLLHEAFVYLASDAGFNVAFTLSEHELSSPVAKRISEVSSLLRDARVQGDNVLCVADVTDYACVRAIEAEAGVEVLRLSTCTTGDPTPLAYINAMEANIALLARALGGSN